MKRAFLALAATALLSCQSSDVAAPVSSEGEGRIALRILSDSPLRQVDSVRITVTNVQDDGSVSYVDSAQWSEGGVRLDGLPLDKNLRIQLQGWMYLRGRRQVYWSGTTNTTLSKSSTSWDFTQGAQTVPLTVVGNADTIQYVAPVLSQVVGSARGAIQSGVLSFEMQSGVSDTVRIDAAGIDTVYNGSAAVSATDGKFLVIFTQPDTVSLLLVGHYGATTTLKVEAAAAAAPIQGQGLSAKWVSPSTGSWVGDSAKLVLKVESGEAKRVVLRFGAGDSLALDSVGSGQWEAMWIPAPGSTSADLHAWVVGAQGDLDVPLKLNVDMAAPVIDPANFRRDVALRVGSRGDTLEWTVSDSGRGVDRVWAAGAGVVGEVFRSGNLYAVATNGGAVSLHASDLVGHVDTLVVSTLLDLDGPALTVKDSTGLSRAPGDIVRIASAGMNASLSVGATDPAGVDSIFATNGSLVVLAMNGTLHLPTVGTWNLVAVDSLGNHASWGSLVVAVAGPAFGPPSVFPANGVFGANSTPVLKFGDQIDTLVPEVRCDQGTAMIRPTGLGWRAFNAGSEFYALPGGTASADFACANGADTSTVVHRTWIMLHDPWVSNLGAGLDTMTVNAFINGGGSKTPTSSHLQACLADSLTCSGSGATWTLQSQGFWEKLVSDSVSASFRLYLDDTANGNNRVYSRVVHRRWGVRYPPRRNWVYPFPTKAADTAALHKLIGATVYSDAGVDSVSLSADDSGLVFRVVWGANDGFPTAAFTLPLDPVWGSWNLDSLQNMIVQYNASKTEGVAPYLYLESSLYDTAETNHGTLLGWLGLWSNPWSVKTNAAGYMTWAEVDSTAPTLAVVRKKVSGLRFSFNPATKGSEPKMTFRLRKLSFDGMIKPSK